MTRFKNSRTKRRSGFGRYPLEYVALGLLMVTPRHGYGLHREFEESFRLIWKAGQTKFYIVLANLEEDGYLEVTTEPQETGPDRKVYHITERGCKAVLDWLHQPVSSMQAIRVEFIAKLRLYNLMGRPGALQLIDEQTRLVEKMLVEWKQEAAEEDEAFVALVHGYRQHQAQAILDWLHDCRREYRQYFERDG